MRLIAIILCLAALASCSAMLIGGGTSSSPAIGSDSRTSAEIASDDAIARAVGDAIAGDPALRASNLSVKAKAAVITLSGTVASFEMRDRALEIAGNTRGVSRVSNNIQVRTKQ